MTKLNQSLKMFSNRKAGIVSWGIGCGGVGTPAIYTHVAKAACWIDSQVSFARKVSLL